MLKRNHFLLNVLGKSFLMLVLLINQTLPSVINFGVLDNMFGNSIPMAEAANNFDIIVNKTLSGSLQAGSTVQYIITYYNQNGTAVNGLSLSDNYGSGLTYLSIQSSNPSLIGSGINFSHDITGKVLTWDGIDLPAITTGTAILNFLVNTGVVPPDTISNSASVSCNIPGGDEIYYASGNASMLISQTYTPPSSFDLQIIKEEVTCSMGSCTPTSSSYTQGSNVFYRLKVKNNSSSTVNNVVFVDQHPSLLNYVGVYSAPTKVGKDYYNSSFLVVSFSDGFSLAPSEEVEVVLEFVVGNTECGLPLSLINNSKVGILTNPYFFGSKLGYDGSAGNIPYPIIDANESDTANNESNNTITVNRPTCPPPGGGGGPNPPSLPGFSGTHIGYDLSIDSISDASSYNPGDFVTYTLTLYNSGVNDKYVYLDSLFKDSQLTFKELVFDPDRFIDPFNHPVFSQLLEQFQTKSSTINTIDMTNEFSDISNSIPYPGGFFGSGTTGISLSPWKGLTAFTGCNSITNPSSSQSLRYQYNAAQQAFKGVYYLNFSIYRAGGDSYLVAFRKAYADGIVALHSYLSTNNITKSWVDSRLQTCVYQASYEKFRDNGFSVSGANYYADLNKNLMLTTNYIQEIFVNGDFYNIKLYDPINVIGGNTKPTYYGIPCVMGNICQVANNNLRHPYNMGLFTYGYSRVLLDFISQYTTTNSDTTGSGVYYADVYDRSIGVNNSYYKVANDRIARTLPVSIFRPTATSSTIKNEIEDFISSQTAKTLLLDLRDVNNYWGGERGPGYIDLNHANGYSEESTDPSAPNPKILFPTTYGKYSYLFDNGGVLTRGDFRDLGTLLNNIIVNNCKIIDAIPSWISISGGPRLGCKLNFPGNFYALVNNIGGAAHNIGSSRASFISPITHAGSFGTIGVDSYTSDRGVGLFKENTPHTILVPANSTGVTVQVKMQVRSDICNQVGTLHIPFKSRIATCDYSHFSNGKCSFNQFTWVDEIIPGANNTDTVDVDVSCPSVFSGQVYDISVNSQNLSTSIVSSSTFTTDNVVVCNNSSSSYSDIRLIYTHDTGLDYLSRSGPSGPTGIYSAPTNTLTLDGISLASNQCQTFSIQLQGNSNLYPGYQGNNYSVAGRVIGGIFQIAGEVDVYNNNKSNSFTTPNLTESSFLGAKSGPFPAQAEVGGTVNFVLTIQNNTSKVGYVDINDVFDTGYNFVSAVIAGTTNYGTNIGNTITWNNIQLNPGETKYANITLSVGSVPNGTILNNFASYVMTTSELVSDDNCLNNVSSITGNVTTNTPATPIHGSCGTISGSTLYDFDNGGDILNSGSINLCTTGRLNNFNFNTGTHIWTWSCDGLNSGTTAVCSATESYCGDGIIGTGVGYTNQEQCDLGAGNGANSACSVTCQLNTPVCNSVNVNPSLVIPGQSSTITASGSSWASGTLKFGVDTLVIGNPVSYGTSFNSAGLYVFSYTLNNPLSGSITALCSGTLTVTATPITGVCNNTITNQTYYTGNLPATGTLCTTGTLTGLTQTSTGWTWTCAGSNGGASQNSCTLAISFCGDGIIGTGNGYAGQEQCEPSLQGSACNASCQLVTPVCNGLIASPSSLFPGGSTIVNGSGSSRASGILSMNGTQVALGNPVTFGTALNLLGTYTFTYVLNNPFSGALVSNTCTATVNVASAPINGVCNATMNGQTYYTGNLPDTGSLCSSGTLTGLTQTSTGWTWTCAGSNGGASQNSCTLAISYCGDGIIGTGNGYAGQEQCDLGTSNGANSACSATCTLNTPVCNGIIPVSGTTLIPGSWNTTIIASGSSWSSGTLFLNSVLLTTGNPLNYGTSFTIAGTYVFNYILSNPLSGAIVANCSTTIIASSAINGQCNTLVNGLTYYTGNAPVTSALCSYGILSGLVQTATGRVWSCIGSGGGINQNNCQIMINYCGDGVIGGGIGYSEAEYCDDGNTDDNDSCRNNCTEPLSYCGDGIVQAWEGCDDGNFDDGDGCDSARTFFFESDPMGDLLNLIDDNPWKVRRLFITQGGGDIFYPGSVTVGQTVGIFDDLFTLIPTALGISADNYNNQTSILRIDNINPNLPKVGGPYIIATFGLCGAIPSDGICGPYNGSTIYDFNNSGDSLNANSSGLCDYGTVSRGGFNSITHTRSWICNGFAGGNGVNCQSQESYCGDGIIGTGNGYTNQEQCDLGTGNGVNSTCSATCTLNTPVCNGLLINPNPIFPAQSVTISASGSVRASGGLYLGSLSNLLVSGNPISYGTSFNTVGTYTIIYQLNNPISGTLIANCSGILTVNAAPITGVCNNTITNQTYYTGNLPNTADLCSSGTLTGLTQTSTGWTWSCEGINGGTNDNACSLAISYCGDGVLGTGNGYANEEQYDDGNNIDGDGVSSTCQYEAPTCTVGLTFTPNSGFDPLLTTGTWSTESWATTTFIDFGDASSQNNPTSPIGHIYNGVNTYTASITVASTITGSTLTGSCTGTVVVSNTPINGMCNATMINQTYYTGNLPATGSLCATGTLTGLTQTSTGWTWSCEGINGGTNDNACKLAISYCGDGIIGTGNGYTNQEQCDLGTGNSSTGACSLTCQNQSPGICGSKFNGKLVSSLRSNSKGLCDLGSVVGFTTTMNGNGSKSYSWACSNVGILSSPACSATTPLGGNCSGCGLFDLSVNKEIISSGPYAIGSIVSYRLSFANISGNMAAVDIDLTDILPSGQMLTGIMVYNNNDNYTGFDLSGQSLSWIIEALEIGESGWIEYNVLITSGVSLPSINIVSIIPSTGTEIVPYATGLCTTGMNPISGDYAVSGTNNVDCEEVIIEYCGDGRVNGIEQYDDGNNIDGDGVSSTCQYEAPTCTVGLTFTPNSGFDPLLTTGTWSTESWATTTFIDFGDASSQNNPTSPIGHIYNGVNTYTASITVASTITGSTLTGSCTGTVVVSNAPINGMCNVSMVNETFYTGNLPATGSLCTVGTLTGLTETSTGWTWSCEGINGGTNDNACNLAISYCGDGIIGTGIGYVSGTEMCEPANTPTCSATCQPLAYDLALIKQLSGVASNFVSGDSLTFNITVTNQGAVDASGVMITDYIPAGLTLADAAWFDNGTGTATFIAPLSIATGASQVISITFIVNGSVTGSILNRSEISVDDGNDIDSTPDTMNGTGSESTLDNEVNNTSGDEDDHDRAEITVIDTPINGMCNATMINQTFYTGNLPNTVDLCTSGTLTGLSQTSTGWTWSCEGINGGTNDNACSLAISYCGDGVLGTGNGYANEEQCDLGTGNSSTGACSLTCQNQSPGICGSKFNGKLVSSLRPNSKRLCDLGSVTGFITTINGDGSKSYSWACSNAGILSSPACSATTPLGGNCSGCGIFDLSVNKEIISSGPYAIGSIVSYRLSFANVSGNMAAVDIDLTDMLPSGQMLTGIIVYDNNDNYTGFDLSGQSLSWIIEALEIGESGWIEYNVLITSGVSLPSINIVSIIPSTGTEIVPYVTGICTTGMNPMSGDYAVSGTNNVDCEEVIIEYCGDGIVNGIEQYDDGNNIDGDGVSSTCQYEAPTCTVGLTFTPNSGFDPLLTTGTWSTESWATTTFIDFGDASSQNNPTSPIGHIYNGVNTYTASITVASTITGSTLTGSCTGTVVVSNAPINGMCNVSMVNETFYTGNLPATGSLCTVGTLTGLTETSTGWTWSCEGINGGTNDNACSLAISYCGDGVLGTGNGYANEEQYDDGNNIDGDGVSSTCQYEAPTCVGVNFAPTAGVPGLEVFATLPSKPGFIYTNLDRTEVIINNPVNGTSHIFNNVGLFPISVTVSNSLNTGISINCTGSVNISNAPINGMCNATMNNQTFYTGNLPNTADLCASGTLTGLTETSTGWTWSCEGINGGTNDNACSLAISYCGDGVLGTGNGYANEEQYDDGNNIDGDGVSSTCQYEAPTCVGVNFAPTAGVPGLEVFATLPSKPGFIYTNLDRTEVIINNPVNGTSHIFNNVGLFPISVTVSNSLNTGISINCTGSVNISNAPINGMCNATMINQTYYTGNLPNTADLCASGTLTGLTETSTGWTWSCEGINGGTNDNACSLAISYCGDGVLGTGNGYANEERYDDGNNIDGDGVSSTCQYEAPTCVGVNFAPTAGVPGLEVFATLPSKPGFIYTNLDRTEVIINNPVNGTSHIFNNVGLFPISVTVSNSLNTGISINCTGSVNISNAPINGMCNATMINQTYYTGNLPNTADLCASGALTGLTETSIGWTWSCEGINGGTNDNACSLAISYCGDGVLGTGNGYANEEQYDDGNNIDGDGVSSTCQYEAPTCVGVNFAPTAGVPGLEVFATLPSKPGFIYTNLDRTEVIINNPVNGTSHIFNNVGLFPISVTVSNSLNTGISINCTGSVNISNAPINGMCNATMNNQIFYTGNLPNTVDLCTSGTLTGLTETSTGWTWSCEGINGGTNDNACSLAISYCGDGIIGTGIGYVSGTEICEPANTATCDLMCQPIIAPLSYDLALTKTVSGSTTNFVSGDTLTFNITVTNQGAVDASGVMITDYIPAGLTLADAAWSDNGNTATFIAPLSIATGASQVISITFIVNGSVTGSILNRSEISDDNGNDIDSTPDTMNGTGSESTLDNEVYNTSGDEDDHDRAEITVTIIPTIMTGSYDLSITKLVNKSIVYSGDVISYTLNYSNLGDEVSGVVINEIYPTQFITDFPSTFTIGYLATGASASIVITGVVVGVSGDSLFNDVSIYYYNASVTGNEISYSNNKSTAVVLISEPVTYIPGTSILPGGTSFTPIPLPTPIIPTPFEPIIVNYEKPISIMEKIKRLIINPFDYISNFEQLEQKGFVTPQTLPNTGAGDELIY